MIDFKNGLESLSEKHSIHIEYYEKTTSTNDIASNGRYVNGDIIIADCQTKGRGQRGHSWESNPDENLTFTIVIEPDHIPAGLQFYISKIIPLSITKVLSQYDIHAKIKWTNDVYVENKKVAGILIENDITGSFISKSIAGIGLNVNQVIFDANLPNPVSMAQLTGITHDRLEVLDKLISYFFHYLTLLNGGYFDVINRDYLANLYRKNELYSFIDVTGKIFKATIRDVMESGELILEHEDGKFKSYPFREIEFVI